MKKELLYPKKFYEDLCDNISPVVVIKKKFYMNPDVCFLLWNEKKKIKERKTASDLSRVNLPVYLNSLEQSSNLLNKQISYFIL